MSMHSNRRQACRTLVAFGAFGALPYAVRAEDAPAGNPRAKPDRWPKIHASHFEGRKILEDPSGVIALQTPPRADDAAVVPVMVRALMPQTAERHIRRITLVIDNNPSPVGAIFNFTTASGRADIETRVRVEEYTTVRAIAELNTGELVMDSRFLKASGGCSAPAGKDAAAALANLGKMKLRVEPGSNGAEPALAQLMISHPNISGLAIDQLTRLAPAPRYVRSIELTLAGQPLMSADVDFTLSENPHLRFRLQADQGGLLRAKVVDTASASFQAEVPVAARLGTA